MAARGEVSRVIIPYTTSLFHLAMVKNAISLFNDFGLKTLETVFRKIQHRNSVRRNKGRHENCNPKTAMEKLLLIPEHLREAVLKAVRSLHCAVQQWKMDHSRIIYLNDGECTFYWRAEGTIDRTKTAQQLVLNANIHIKIRLHIACMYCLHRSVQTLWAEMEASGQTENFETANNPMTYFWVRWMREASRVPWLQAVRECLEFPRALWAYPIPRFSSFFPLLLPQDREKFIKSLRWAKLDDFRFCLYAATKEEEDEILKTGFQTLLFLYLDWPLQSFFLETAEKVWHLIDASSFNVLLRLILDYNEGKKDFDYNGLFVDLWKRSSIQLRESAREDPHLSKRIDFCFNEIRRRFSSDINRKKWIRIDGRLESSP